MKPEQVALDVLRAAYSLNKPRFDFILDVYRNFCRKEPTEIPSDWLKIGPYISTFPKRKHKHLFEVSERFTLP